MQLPKPNLEQRTQRLLLRQWRPADFPLFAAMKPAIDPRVMEFFPAMLDAGQSGQMATRIQTGLAEKGFGLWAVEVPGVHDFIGLVGLAAPGFKAHFTPCIEIGWRLAFEHWGHGYATEAARHVLAHAVGDLAFPELVSYTAQEKSPLPARHGAHWHDAQ